MTRHDSHHDSGHHDCPEDHCRLGVEGRRRFHRDEKDHRLCRQRLEGAEGRCRLDVADRYHRDAGDHCRPDVEGRCHLLDVVDHRDAEVRLDVMNCLDLGVRSWKAESAGDRRH